MPDKFYITTPIYYVNARPHIGHALMAAMSAAMIAAMIAVVSSAPSLSTG